MKVHLWVLPIDSKILTINLLNYNADFLVSSECTVYYVSFISSK